MNPKFSLNDSNQIICDTDSGRRTATLPEDAMLAIHVALGCMAAALSHVEAEKHLNHILQWAFYFYED